MYKLLRSVLFFFDAEKVHYFTTGMLRFVLSVPGGKLLFKQLYCVDDPRLKTEVFGLTFDNPVGLAAGFDKNAKMYNDLAYCGFGFIEIGTLTPKGQPGNEKPRLFRLKQDEAIVNRMGFNNDGAAVVAQRLARLRARFGRNLPIIGVNIGKSKITSLEGAVADYEFSTRLLAQHADYLAVNVSSPNTPGLRDLQAVSALRPILQVVQRHSLTKPVLVKIAPDLSDEDVIAVAELVVELGLAGVIATNTTVTRDRLKANQQEIEKIGAGGLSGAPLRSRSLEILTILRQHLSNDFTIISVGGVESADDVAERLKLGANLVQGYTGFVFHGPLWARKINRKASQKTSRKASQ